MTQQPIAPSDQEHDLVVVDDADLSDERFAFALVPDQLAYDSDDEWMQEAHRLDEQLMHEFAASVGL